MVGLDFVSSDEGIPLSGTEEISLKSSFDHRRLGSIRVRSKVLDIGLFCRFCLFVLLRIQLLVRLNRVM